jgi:hypothetical protein
MDPARQTACVSQGERVRRVIDIYLANPRLTTVAQPSGRDI